MNKKLINFMLVLPGLLLISACAQSLPAKAPTSIPADVSTAVSAGAGQPLGEITPETPTMAPPPDPTNAGQLTVTMDDAGKTINLAVGQGFLLKLGEVYTWDLALSDQNVISRVKNIAVIRGAQGVYTANQPGTVTLSASGDPVCRQSKPPCAMASIELEFTFVVK